MAQRQSLTPNATKRAFNPAQSTLTPSTGAFPGLAPESGTASKRHKPLIFRVEKRDASPMAGQGKKKMKACFANLLLNDDAFDSAFKKTHIEEKAAVKQKTGGKQIDHIE